MTFDGIAYASSMPPPMHESAVTTEDRFMVSFLNSLLVRRHNAVVVRTRFTPSGAVRSVRHREMTKVDEDH